MTCDGSQPYRAGHVDVVQDRFSSDRDGVIHYATGPCPVCSHEQTSFTFTLAPIEAQSGVTAQRVDEPVTTERRTPAIGSNVPVEIAFECSCPRAHGEPSLPGCGAAWVVTWRDPKTGTTAGGAQP